METKNVTKEMVDMLRMPINPRALGTKPGSAGLTSIKAIYITERLNEVFGCGAWKVSTRLVSEQKNENKTMVVCHTTLSIPQYGIEYECFGGNDNPDYGDAYKGATTDAITKIGSYLGVGHLIFKGMAKENIEEWNKLHPEDEWEMVERWDGRYKKIEFAKKNNQTIPQAVNSAPKQLPTIDSVLELVNIKVTDTIEGLQKIWNENAHLQTHPVFKQKVTELKAEIIAKGQQPKK